MWFPLLTLHFIGDQNLLVAMTDGEAWLEALGEQLRESEKQIPALAAAQVKLADADASEVAELQQEAATWHSAITSAARAVLGARLSRAAPVMANAVPGASAPGRFCLEGHDAEAAARFETMSRGRQRPRGFVAASVGRRLLLAEAAARQRAIGETLCFHHRQKQPVSWGSHRRCC